MKISLNWLKEFIDLNDQTPQSISQVLTQAGLEVENIVDQGQAYANVVIGQIIEKQAHPHADRLSLCQVTTGSGVVHQIVCGAKNHQSGDFVILALPGAHLPSGIKIERATLRGVESAGMLCSPQELGLKVDDFSGLTPEQKQRMQEGIVILAPSAVAGQQFVTYQGLDDVLFELKITPNRSDCLSHYGLARELACLLSRELKKTNLIKNKESASAETVGGATASLLTTTEMKIEVNNSRLCPRYTGLFVKGVKVGESPLWVKRRLESIGLKSINNVVDATNYVMMEMGQPLHAFDINFLKDRKIGVDLSRAQDSFTTLDGTTLNLTGKELMIYDGQRPVALAGVVGGLNSGIRPESTDIFLESAYFHPSTVRMTSRHFGIETDSSYRFARGVDPLLTVDALFRAAYWIQQWAGGEIAHDHYDIYPQPLALREIQFSLALIPQFLGYSIEAAEFEKILARLGCNYQVLDSVMTAGSGLQGPSYLIKPPLYRGDLEREVDIIEEVARLKGYDLIPITIPQLTGSPSTDHREYNRNDFISTVLVGMGYSQAINYAFEGAHQQSELFGEPIVNSGANTSDSGGLLPEGLEGGAFQTPPLENAQTGIQLAPLLTQMSWSSAVSIPVRLQNPLSEELSVMRRLLLLGLIRNVAHNSRHGVMRGRLFELGSVFGIVNGTEVKESQSLSLTQWGQVDSELWLGAEPYPQSFALKSAVENLLKKMHLKDFEWKEPGSPLPFLHPGQQVFLWLEGKLVGFIGTLHPHWCQKYKIQVPVAVAEILLDPLSQGFLRGVQARPVTAFPCVQRDLAFLMPLQQSAQELVGVMLNAQKDGLIQSVEIFDEYKGENIPSGQKSVAYRLTLQSIQNTLTENQINELVNCVVKAVVSHFSIQVR